MLQLDKFLHGKSRLLDNFAQEIAAKVARVKRHAGSAVCNRMPKLHVTAFLPDDDEASPEQSPQRLPCGNDRQFAHVSWRARGRIEMRPALSALIIASPSIAASIASAIILLASARFFPDKYCE